MLRMWLYVRIYVHMYTNLFVRMYVCMYVRTCKHSKLMYIRTYMCMYVVADLGSFDTLHNVHITYRIKGHFHLFFYVHTCQWIDTTCIYVCMKATVLTVPTGGGLCSVPASAPLAKHCRLLRALCIRQPHPPPFHPATHHCIVHTG